MFFVYDENAPKQGGPFNPDNFDANKCLQKHIENEFYLKFIVSKSDNFLETQQARKELETCYKKQKYWRAQENYLKAAEAKDREALTKKWAA
jgi:ABC-type sugar transport system ATPase subunit